MTYVIGPLCIDKMDTGCVEACPVDCIHLYTGDDPNIPKNMLLIDPEECIDCGACVPACPWEAIYAEDDVPEEFKEFTPLNALIAGQSEKTSPHNSDETPTADEIAANRDKWFDFYHSKG